MSRSPSPLTSTKSQKKHPHPLLLAHRTKSKHRVCRHQNSMDQNGDEAIIDPCKVLTMLEACSKGNLPEIQKLIEENPLYACMQDETTGKSPLMAAAEAGHVEICELLLHHGAPWNAVDRHAQCAGNYATNNEHWDVVNLLVDAGTRAELILGASIRLQKTVEQQQSSDNETTTTETPKTPRMLLVQWNMSHVPSQII